MALHKSKRYTALLVLVVLALFAVAYGFFSKRESTTYSIQSQNSWSTYTNDFIKASFNYPSGWYLNEDVSRVNLAISDYVGGLSTPDEAISQDHIKISFIRTSLLQGQTIDSYVKRNMEPDPSLIIEKESEILVGDLEGKEFTINLGDGKSVRLLHFQKGRTLFTFSVAPASSKLMPIFDQILQSFRILE